MKNQYAGKNAKQVWNEWAEEQREHFLRDHQLSQYYDDDDLVFYLSANLDEIPREIGDTLKRHISEGQYKKGGTPGEYEYYIYEDGNWRKATKADFKYWYDKFASEVMDRFGKTYKKGEIPFSEVENIYNPQGYMVAEKISKMAKGGQYKKGGPIRTEKYKISYLDKKKNFSQTDKIFEGEDAYERARKWGAKNIDNFNLDMISVMYKDGGLIDFSFLTQKVSFIELFTK